MLIHCVIPTKGRLEKLIKCLGSINDAKTKIDDEHRLYVYVYFSVEEELKKMNCLLDKYTYMFTRLLSKEYNVGTFWNNHVKEHNFDIMFYLNDDVILHPDCLKEAIDSMEKHYPNLDGVIGLNQENVPKEQALSTAFAAVGTEYINKFPDRKFFPPYYKRFFGDKEIEEYSSKIGKLYWEKKAKLIHLHPAFVKNAMDDTHTDVRKYLAKDKELYTKRHKQKLLWGETF